MGAVKNMNWDEIEQRAAYADCHNYHEFFEQLDESGIDEIKWDKDLNNSYALWQYLTIK